MTTITVGGFLWGIFVTFIDQQPYQHPIIKLWSLWAVKTLSIFTLIKPAIELSPVSSLTDLLCLSLG